MKWFGGLLGMYEAPRPLQVEALGLLRELFGSPTSDAAVAFLLGIPKAPRRRAPVSDDLVADSVALASVSSSTPSEPGRTWPRPPWLIATSPDAARRADLFRVA